MREIIFLNEDAAGNIARAQELLRTGAPLKGRDKALVRKYQQRGISNPITNKYVTNRGTAVSAGTERRAAIADEEKAKNELNTIEKQGSVDSNGSYDPIPVQNARKKFDAAQNRVGQLGSQGLKASLNAKKELQKMNATPQ